MTVIWTSKAYDDLDEIVGYLAVLSHEAAEMTIDRFQSAVLSLSEFLNLGRKINESRLRRFVVARTPYVIYYRVVADCVNVRGVFHVSQRRFLE